jgi:hypothetical protein
MGKLRSVAPARECSRFAAEQAWEGSKLEWLGAVIGGAVGGMNPLDVVGPFWSAGLYGLTGYLTTVLVRYVYFFWRAPADLAAKRLAEIEEDRGQLKAALVESHSTMGEIVGSQPRIRTEIVHSARPPYSGRWWGVRVYNDGGAAKFEARLTVTGDSSAAKSHAPGVRQLRWTLAHATEAKIMTGAYDDVLFGSVEMAGGSDDPNHVRVQAWDGIAEPFVWQSLSLVGDSPEPFAVVEIRIWADPPLIDQPRTLLLKLAPNGLVDFSPSASNSEAPTLPGFAS